MWRQQVHLLALHEEAEAAPWAAGAAAAKFGFAFLDAAAGRYYVGAVSDDAGPRQPQRAAHAGGRGAAVPSHALGQHWQGAPCSHLLCMEPERLRCCHVF